MNKKKLKLAILKELSKGNTELTEESLGVSKDDIASSADFLLDEEFVRGIDKYIDGVTDFTTARLTLKGEEYLESNSALVKGYNLLKEARDWIKL